jgi:SAM-dependent methyltransferase
VPLDRLDALSIPIPPEALQVQVLGKAATPHSFLYGGLMVAEGLKDALRVLGRPLETFERVLDLGCGCGRVLRFLADDAPGVRFAGSDISAEAIEWDRANLPFARFEVNGPQPPLPFEDGAFDLVVAISVLTHLTEALQLAWLAEWKRVLRPGGLLLVTLQNEHTAAWRLMPDELARFEKDGQAYVVVQPGGLHGLPDFYQDAFHSRAYVERVWAGMFGLRAYVRNGPVYMQDLVVLERSESAADGARPYVWIDLPICSVREPTIGAVVAGPTLTVSGWAFHPRGGVAPIDVWLDGRRVGEAMADQRTPGVARVYPAWAATRSCGFEVAVPLEGIARGVHRLRVTSGTSLVTCSPGYFFSD